MPRPNFNQPWQGLSLKQPRWMEKIPPFWALPLLQRTWQNLAKKILLKKLASLEEGQLEILEEDQARVIGLAKPNSLKAQVKVHHPAAYAETLTGGTVGLADAYLKGHWSSPDLVSLFRLFLKNLKSLENLEKGFAQIKTPLQKLIHLSRKNTKTGSKKNISAHYDLGNDFFKLFLDETLNYSCAYFESKDQNLKEASLSKMKKICDKLKLTPKDHLLEIGSGWGGLAFYATQNYGCQVTTTTISNKQYKYVKAKIQKLKLQNKINIEKKDYRDLGGSYDKLVSVEMIEAIGHQYFGTFFRQCDKLLKPGGLMVLQSILIREDQYERAKGEVDFIKAYIFPGSAMPSVGALNQAMTKNSSLQLLNLEDISSHYVFTLRAWRENFFKNHQKVINLGYSEEFIRLWKYYLCYCEAGFAERYNLDVQMTLKKAYS